MAQEALEKVREIVEPVIEGLGYELVRVSITGRDRATLQVMAERPDGTMAVEDCTAISRELSAILDIEDPIAGQYDLEVSSPGLDRPLTREKDFVRYAGFEAKLETVEPVDGQRRFRGLLEGMNGDEVVLEVDGERRSFRFADIVKAKLVLTDALLQAHGLKSA